MNLGFVSSKYIQFVIFKVKSKTSMEKGKNYCFPEHVPELLISATG
jgi:hypothetical protein